MEKPLGHEDIARIVLLEAHRFVERAADEALVTIAEMPPARERGLHGIPAGVHELKSGTTLGYPPNHEARLSDDELAALSALQLSDAARSALRKIIRAAASQPLFDMFCLLDGVADPALSHVAEWPPIHLAPSRDDGSHREMMHDDFFDSYWQYVAPSAPETR